MFARAENGYTSRMSWGPEVQRMYFVARGSQSAVAKALGVERSRISALLRGDSKPSYENAVAMADALGLQGIEREQFVLLAVIESCPEPVRDRMRALVLGQGAEGSEAAQEIRRLRAERDSLVAQLGEIARHAAQVLGQQPEPARKGGRAAERGPGYLGG
jgi:transcriptional regulator with XRE-family HTH domain